MKVNIVSKKLIEPCTPTPQNLRKHKISFIDDLNPPMNVGVILFYHPIRSKNNPKQITSHLEDSLSKILPQFYPLAGRYIKKDHFVDCNDSGAEFVEAQVVEDVELTDVILASNKEVDLLNDFLPPKFYQVDESPTDPLLSIRITQFIKCGGLVISVTVSHRIFDASSVGTFISVWSNTNNNNNRGGLMRNIKICPSFDSPPEFFPGNYVNLNSRGNCNNWDPDMVIKKFSFRKEAIASLRSKLRSPANSRVRVVCAVIAKAMIGLDRTKYGAKSRDCLIVQAVNMRARTIPPIPKHSCRNWLILSPTKCMSTPNIGIQELVDILGDGLEKTVADCATIFSPTGRDARSMIMEPLANVRAKSMSGEVNVFAFSDWSKFGFYEADFGWGKPIGAGIGAMPRQKMIILMDSKEGDGLEAWVHLNSDDMAYFEQDDQIKLFAT